MVPDKPCATERLSEENLLLLVRVDSKLISSVYSHRKSFVKSLYPPDRNGRFDRLKSGVLRSYFINWCSRRILQSQPNRYTYYFGFRRQISLFVVWTMLLPSTKW